MTSVKSKVPNHKLIQRDVLAKYWETLKEMGKTKDDIAVESSNSKETVRKVFVGISHNKIVLNLLQELFLQVPQFKGKLPADLKNMFKKSLSIQEKVN